MTHQAKTRDVRSRSNKPAFCKLRPYAVEVCLLLALATTNTGLGDPSDEKAVYLHRAQLRYRFNFRDTWPSARQAVPVVMTINL